MRLARNGAFCLRHMRGGAIVVALLAVALVTASATFLVRQQQLWVTQTETSRQLAQARQLLVAGLDWAGTVLADDGRTTNVDHRSEMWARRMPTSHTDNWEINGYIEDAQSRFNLNNLVRDGKASEADIEIYARILQSIGAPPALARSLVDWIDTDSEPQPVGGAEDAAYLQRNPPYRAGNRPLAELANLLRIQGYDAELIERLRPLVCVLPRPTPVNINTAEARVIAALVPGLSTGEAQALASTRDQTAFENLGDFEKRLPRQDLKFRPSDLSIGSNFFWVTGEAASGETKMGMTALLMREGQARPSIVWRREW